MWKGLRTEVNRRVTLQALGPFLTAVENRNDFEAIPP